MNSSSRKTAKFKTSLIPGTFLVAKGMGVLLLGKSGVGKSDCALELTAKGNKFIADDCVRIRKKSPQQLVGSNPAKSGFPLHIRGLGILDLEKMFGPKNVKQSHSIDFVIHLEKWQKKELYLDLAIKKTSHEIAGVKIPSLHLPVTTSRHIATLIETAIKQRLLKKG